MPVSIKNFITGEVQASCPVLIKPSYDIRECSEHIASRRGYEKTQGIKRLYQSLKYTFTTPFNLVEVMGFASGIWMGMKSLIPGGAATVQAALKKFMLPAYEINPDLTDIPLKDQVDLGFNVLKVMGMTENFAPLVVVCGHGSKTENNAYATALDCGACGGRHGDSNARVLVEVLNSKLVREQLVNKGIDIPDDTIFLAALHNTTTDAVEIYDHNAPEVFSKKINDLKDDLEKARDRNTVWRNSKMQITNGHLGSAKDAAAMRSEDWAQIRPEWGLANNAAFIIGPRRWTKNIDLEGRSFLHSYEWSKDQDFSSLEAILTAPMVVAQWINAQYLFSTLDNVAFGGGSKVTKNITGKIGVIQGNASDLMHGLPLQSVFKSDKEPYHNVQRLHVVVFAPRLSIRNIVKRHQVLKRLFSNEWIHLTCYDPNVKKSFSLKRDLTWVKLQE